MNAYAQQLRLLVKRLALLLLLFFICRLTFYFANHASFESASLSELLIAFAAGLRFDLMTIISINFLFIFLHLVPGNWFYSNVTQGILRFLFLLVNIPALLLNCIDLEYFKFQGKRTTADLFQLFGMGDDMKNTIPQMAIDFWYVILIFAILTLLLIYFYNHIRVVPPFEKQRTGYPATSPVYSTDASYVPGQFVISKNSVLPPGALPRRLAYPDVEVSRNSNTPELVPITTPVWWGKP